jgi:hypothetical protein
MQSCREKFLLGALLVVGLGPAAACCSEVLTIPPRQDAYVDGASRILLDRELVVGFRAFVNQDQEYRAALQFDLPPWLASNQVENATLRLHYFDAWGSFNPRLIRAHGIVEAWSTSSPPPFIAHGPELSGVEVGGAFRSILWDVTSAAQTWATNAALNHGILLVAEPSGLADNALRFHSTRSKQVALHPILEITWTVPVAPSPTLAVTPRSGQEPGWALVRRTWWMLVALLLILVATVMVMRRKKPTQ